MTNDEYEKAKTAKDPTVVQNVISYLCREMVKKDKEIAELKSDLELFMDLCDKKDEWLQYYKKRAEDAERSSDDYHEMVALVLEKDKEIASLKAEIQNEYDLSVYRSSLE